jgi:hypothetical protein
MGERGMTPWRAGCAETCTSGSEGGPRKRARRKPGTAPRPDPYTEHPTREGKVYCCVVLDAFSRYVVGWSIDSTQTTLLVLNALGMATLHHQIRKTIKTRGHFPTEEAARKLIYLSIIIAQKNWPDLQLDVSTARIQNPLRKATALTRLHRKSDTLPECSPDPNAERLRRKIGDPHARAVGLRQGEHAPAHHRAPSGEAGRTHRQKRR